MMSLIAFPQIVVFEFRSTGIRRQWHPKNKKLPALLKRVPGYSRVSPEFETRGHGRIRAGADC